MFARPRPLANENILNSPKSWPTIICDERAQIWFHSGILTTAPCDSSASAIVGSALLDMAALHPDEQRSAKWRAQAFDILTVLCRRYLATEPSHRGLLREGCYSKPHNEGVKSAVMFGDFFFAEALCAAAMPGRLRATPRRLAV
jgi:unsaturated chondroitin disaccharide hydrolase